MARPLEDIRILDLTWILSGPYASMVLCDLGADVIKVERAPFGDVARTQGPYANGWSAYFFSVNRGKRSISIDLRNEEGRALFLDLVGHADVVMENFTPGTMERFGLGYEALAARNPGIIFARISGFGQTGPYKDRPALDVIVQGMGGVMSITGEPGGGPVRPGVSYGDIVAGLYAAIGILTAMHERTNSGKGQQIDISMLDCQVSVLENALARYYVTGKAPEPLGTRHPTATPFQAFPTADGYLVIALSFGEANQWGVLCGLLGLPELIDDERYNTGPKRTRNHSNLEPLLIAAFRQRSTADWLDDLLAAEIPCGPVNSVADIAADPQVAARGMLQEVTHHIAGPMRIANSPVRMSRSESGIKGPPPDMGQHTVEVLGELLGLDAATVKAMEGRKVVATKGGPDIASLL